VKVVSQNLAKTMVTIWIMATTKLDGILYFDLFSRDESVYIFSGNSTKYLKKNVSESLKRSAEIDQLLSDSNQRIIKLQNDLNGIIHFKFN
jgi:hypothetical protein